MSLRAVKALSLLQLTALLVEFIAAISLGCRSYSELLGEESILCLLLGAHIVCIVNAKGLRDSCLRGIPPVII